MDMDNRKISTRDSEYLVTYDKNLRVYTARGHGFHLGPFYRRDIADQACRDLRSAQERYRSRCLNGRLARSGTSVPYSTVFPRFLESPEHIEILTKFQGKYFRPRY